MPPAWMDPLNMACEGCAVVVCPGKSAGTVLDSLRSKAFGRNAKAIGHVIKQPKGLVILETEVGGERIVETPMGEDLPRIC